MSATTTPQKVKRGPNGETRKRPGDLEPWEFNEEKELIISTSRGFFCAIPHLDENGSLEFCGADTEFINEEKLRDHIQDHHIGRKKEAIKLAVEVKRPENAAAKKKWAFLPPTYPYFLNHGRQSSVAPSVGWPESFETSVPVDYSTWGFGDERMNPMAPYGQTATNTTGYPASAPNPSAKESGSLMPYVQYNTLPGPPSYNPRATPEQLSAELLARLQQVKQMTPQELSESMQKHFPGLPIYPRLDPRFSALFNNAHTTTNLTPSANTFQAATLSFIPFADTLRPTLNDVQTKPILNPSLTTEQQQPRSASAMIFSTDEVSPYTSLQPIGTQVESLTSQPHFSFQNSQHAPFAHHDLRQGQVQEFLTQVEQNSPFRDPFPAEVFHPSGWVDSAMKRRERLGWERGR